LAVIKPVDGKPEGRRDRKRREMRARIAEVAMRLFRERGFQAVTIDEIAEGADVSKPTFFNYFPAKEDVVQAWQDQFADALTDALLARPAEEGAAAAVKGAMLAALAATASPEAFALDALIQATPMLAQRNQAKYLYLETRLAEALVTRNLESDHFELRLLAMLSIGALRIGTETWRADGSLQPSELMSYAETFFEDFWASVEQLAVNRSSGRGAHSL
jgi:AcrR family transcriptional regulator